MPRSLTVQLYGEPENHWSIDRLKEVLAELMKPHPCFKASVACSDDYGPRSAWVFSKERYMCEKHARLYIMVMHEDLGTPAVNMARLFIGEMDIRAKNALRYKHEQEDKEKRRRAEQQRKEEEETVFRSFVRDMMAASKDQPFDKSQITEQEIDLRIQDMGPQRVLKAKVEIGLLDPQVLSKTASTEPNGNEQEKMANVPKLVTAQKQSERKQATARPKGQNLRDECVSAFASTIKDADVRRSLEPELIIPEPKLEDVSHK